MFYWRSVTSDLVLRWDLHAMQSLVVLSEDLPVPDHGHELDRRIWGEAEGSLLPLGSVVNTEILLILTHAPPGVVVVSLGHGQVVVPPSADITLKLVKGWRSFKKVQNFTQKRFQHFQIIKLTKNVCDDLLGFPNFSIYIKNSSQILFKKKNFQ